MTDWFNLPWWGWVVFGILLALLDLASPGGFYFMVFGVSAVLVGALVWMNVLAEPWLQITFFSIFAVIASLFFRRPLLAKFGPHTPNIPVDSMLGEIGNAIEDIQPSGFGKIELRGAAWSARNNGSNLLARGQRCIVERVDGLSVWVRPD